MNWTPIYCNTAHLGSKEKAANGGRWSSLQIIADTVVDLINWFPGCGLEPHRHTLRGADALEQAKAAGERWIEKGSI
jgi:hypothetical protein